MVVTLALAQLVVGHQLPLFMLVFGVIYLALAFVIKPLGGALVLPTAMLIIALSVGWFAMDNGILAMSTDVLEVLGIGIVLVFLGRMFAG